MTIMGRAAMAIAIGALMDHTQQVMDECPRSPRSTKNWNRNQELADKYRAERAARKRAAYAKRNKDAIGDKP